jgi:hypothetical protein
MGWTAGVRILKEVRFLFSTGSKLSLGHTQLPGAKRPGYHTDHSLAFSAEVKNGGEVPPLPQTLSYPSDCIINYNYNSSSLRRHNMFPVSYGRGYRSYLRWIMSRIVIVILIYRRHKPIDLIYDG